VKHFVSLNQIIQILILGTVIFVPFVYVPLWEVNDFFYYPKYITLVIVTCTLLIMCLFNLNDLKSLFKFDLINKFLLIYFTLITLSLFFSLDPILSLHGKFLRNDGYVTHLMYILLFLFARNIRTIPIRFIFLVSISSSILSFYGIIQYLGFELFTRDLMRMNWTSAFSTFGNQNFFGSYLVLQIPFSLYIIIFLQKKWAYITFGMSFLALLMTMTRGAWIGFFISILTLFFIYFIQDRIHFLRNKHIWGSITLSILIIIGYNLLTMNDFFNRFLTMINDSKTFFTTSYAENPKVFENLGSIRMFIWIRVLKLIQMRPIFGFGIENLHIAFSKYFSQDIIQVLGQQMIVDKAHNDFLHISVSTGIPSLIAYLSFIFTVFFNALKCFDNYVNILLFASVLGYVMCLFFNISVVSVAYIMWIYLGLICSYQEDLEINTGILLNEEILDINDSISSF
jgi:O-antigen ligase